MRLTIDQNDGQGGLDYTAALMQDASLTVVRERGEWARCMGGLDVLGAGLPTPQSRARVRVADDTGAVLFEGILAGGSAADTAEAAWNGVQERPVFQAVETGWLTAERPVEVLQPATAVRRSLALSDLTLSRSQPGREDLEAMAADVTVSGAMEPSAYVTELFHGDGTTQVFALMDAPFDASARAVLLDELFADAALRASAWLLTDAGGYLRLGAGGLRMAGGNGSDGTTVLSYAEPVEMGGMLVAEMTGVQLAAGSDGILLGFYTGAVTHAGCIAGVRVVGTASATELVAVVQGVDQPVTYTFTPGHVYTLRVRVHCVEMQRRGATYTVCAGGAVQMFGGAVTDAALQVVIEVVDTGLASSTLPAVLYAGGLSSSPAACTFAAVNSVSLTGSIGGVRLVQTGSVRVVSTATDGAVTVRREGEAGTGADFTLSGTGLLRFDTGRVPQPGERVTVTYRRGRRSVARLGDATAEQMRLQMGLPGLPKWSGGVVSPTARSSKDCAAAARALLALAADEATGRTGSLEWLRGTATLADVLPGDTLVLQTEEGEQVLPVQAVTITDGNCAPELLRYTVRFGQGRAESLDFRVSGSLAEDAGVPVRRDVTVGVAPASEEEMALPGLQVVAASTSVLQMDAGADPPAGGGFEVRRSDANFGAADTTDLVLNSPVRGFAIPRAAFAERFFVRMYDGGVPRRYAATSSVVLTHLPVD